MSVALKSEKIVAVEPPKATAPAVRKHRQTLVLARDALQASAPALALEAALGQFGAKDAFANLIWKMKTLEYELGLYDQVVALAMAQDTAAETAWRSAIQELPADEIVQGIGREVCCSRCSPGTHNGCVISTPAARSGGVCCNPVSQRHLWYRNEEGRVIFPYADDPRCYELHLAACRRLKVAP
jgi:hypothetical protein